MWLDSFLAATNPDNVDNLDHNVPRCTVMLVTGLQARRLGCSIIIFLWLVLQFLWLDPYNYFRIFIEYLTGDLQSIVMCMMLRVAQVSL